MIQDADQHGRSRLRAGALLCRRGLPGGLLLAGSFAVTINVQSVTGGTSPWLLPPRRRGSGPRPCRSSAGQDGATTRHLRPRVTAGRADAAAHCRPHRTGLTGAGRVRSPYSREPGTDHVVRHGRAGRPRGPELPAPPAGDVFCAAVSLCFLPWLCSDTLTVAPPRSVSDNPLTHWHAARYRPGSLAGGVGWWDHGRQARGPGWCRPPPAAVRA